MGEQMATSMYFPNEADRLTQISVIKANADIAVATVTSAWYSIQEMPENNMEIFTINTISRLR